MNDETATDPGPTVTAERVEPTHVQPRWRRMRLIFAVLCGVVAGVLVPNSLQVGARWFFSAPDEWGMLFWEEHWIVRPVASVLAAAAAAFVAGAVARRAGTVVALLAVTPGVLLWVFASVSAWREEMLFTSDFFYVSIGNKIAGTVIVVALPIVAMMAGPTGEEFGRENGPHFDRRPRTLFGVSWFHYIWLPFLIHAVLAQTAWAGIYGFEWLKTSWRAGPTMGAMIPTVFVMALWATFALLYSGVWRAYQLLAGFELTQSAWHCAKGVLASGFGRPLLAAVLQSGIMLIHYGLSRLVG
jgi:hypothetical protein